jgi:uncharacterized protein (DUF1501 family)
MPLWQAGELAFVHATSTPYRDKRSHFDGQDLLEAGDRHRCAAAAQRDGWLNRLLQAVPGTTRRDRLCGRAARKHADPGGPAPVRNGRPDQDLALSGQGRLLLDHVYHMTTRCSASRGRGAGADREGHGRR